MDVLGILFVAQATVEARTLFLQRVAARGTLCPTQNSDFEKSHGLGMKPNRIAKRNNNVPMISGSRSHTSFQKQVCSAKKVLVHLS